MQISTYPYVERPFKWLFGLFSCFGAKFKVFVNRMVKILNKSVYAVAFKGYEGLYPDHLSVKNGIRFRKFNAPYIISVVKVVIRPDMVFFCTHNNPLSDKVVIMSST